VPLPAYLSGENSRPRLLEGIQSTSAEVESADRQDSRLVRTQLTPACRGWLPMLPAIPQQVAQDPGVRFPPSPPPFPSCGRQRQVGRSTYRTRLSQGGVVGRTIPQLQARPGPRLEGAVARRFGNQPGEG
jgi:hypothetical protein